MEILLFWIAFAVAIAFWAGKWNRNAFLWCLLAIFISPILAAIFLAIAGRNGETCPHCGGFTVPGAAVCKNCGRDIAIEPPSVPQ